MKGNVPLFFDEHLAPITLINDFIQRHSRKNRGRGRNTEKAYADDITQLLVFCVAQGKDLLHLEEDDVVEFAACLIEGVSAKTGEPFDRDTVKRRVMTAVQLCRFGTQSKAMSAEWATIEGATSSIMAQADGLEEGSPIANAIAQKKRSTVIHPIDLRKVERIFGVLGPEKWLSSTRISVRNRLAAELSLATGMRVMEIAELTIYQIQQLEIHIDEEDQWKIISLVIDATKGYVQREVLISQYLLVRLLQYIDGERAAIISEARKRGKFREGRQNPTKLFLNGLGSNARDIGEPCSANVLSRAFSAALIRLGMVLPVTKFVLDDDANPVLTSDGDTWLETVAWAPSHTFHDLRHTFAFENYFISKRRGEDGIKRIQLLLGHAFRRTTEDIYLRFVDVREPEVSDDYAKLLRSIDGWSRR